MMNTTLPKMHFPCGMFVESKQLKKLPKDMMLLVDASMLCARVHTCRGEDLSHKPKRFREIYEALERILFNKLPDSYCVESSDNNSFKSFLESAYLNGVNGIFPIKPHSLYGFSCDTCKMTVEDIRLFLGDDIPTTTLKLLPEHRDIVLKREEDAERKKNFVKLGTYADVLRQLDNCKSITCKVFFDKNTNRLVVCEPNEKPWKK